MDIASSLSPDINATRSNKKTPGKKSKGRKRWLPGLSRLLVVLVILGGLAVAAYTWQAQKTASAAQQPTITLPVTQGNLDITVQSNGKVQASREQSVTYETTGDVVEVLVKSGDKVDAGQTLVRQTDQVQKQAVTEAEAALSTARAKLDDLKKGPTEADVVSAQAEVASAQAALDSVKAGSSPKEIADAQAELRAAEADMATVKAGATTKEIADAQSDLKTAQATYDQVKAGATTKQIADAQADLKAAQAKYDVLVAAPSAVTVKEAQSKLAATKAKLAAVKAEPKPADLSKAQLAVTEAQASLKTTQDSSALAKQTEQLAIEKANRDLQQAQREYGTIAGQVLDEKGNFSIDPNDRDYNSLYTEYWTAYNNLKDAEANQIQALADLDNTLKKEVQEVGSAQAKLDDAKKQLEVVKAGATPDEQATAQLDVDSAQKALEDLTQGAARDEMATAQAAVIKAQTALDQLKAGSTKDELASAEADVVKAQTALDQLRAGPTQGEIATAQMAVDKARNNLIELQAGPTADKVTAAQATVAQKKASLQGLYEPASTSEISAAEEAVVSAQKAVDDANTDLGKTVLKAPFSGIVAAVSAEPNAKVTVGAEAVSIYDESGMHLELDVNESDIQLLKVGQPSAITVDALPGQVLTGTVSQVSNVSQTNQDVVTYQVDVEFSPGTAPIKTGMSASATITVESHEGVIQVPTRALKTQGRNKTLDVLYGEGKTPVTISVTTGASNSQMTEIVSCVDTNNQCLRAGDTVAVTVATSTTSTGNTAAPGAFGQQGFPVQGPGTGTRQFPRP